MNDNQGPISLSLFHRVDEYTKSIRSGAVTDRMTLDEHPAIYLFYQSFFHQFFDYLGKGSVTSFDENAKNQANNIGESLTGLPAAPVRAVIYRFEDFCDINSDLVAGQYFASRDDFLLFHRRYVPELLQCIEAWATSANLPDLADRCHRALGDYQATVAFF